MKKFSELLYEVERHVFSEADEVIDKSKADEEETEEEASAEDESKDESEEETVEVSQEDEDLINDVIEKLKDVDSSDVDEFLKSVKEIVSILGLSFDAEEAKEKLEKEKVVELPLTNEDGEQTEVEVASLEEEFNGETVGGDLVLRFSKGEKDKIEPEIVVYFSDDEAVQLSDIEFEVVDGEEEEIPTADDTEETDAPASNDEVPADVPNEDQPPAEIEAEPVSYERQEEPYKEVGPIKVFEQYMIAFLAPNGRIRTKIVDTEVETRELNVLAVAPINQEDIDKTKLNMADKKNIDKKKRSEARKRKKARELKKEQKEELQEAPPPITKSIQVKLAPGKWTRVRAINQTGQGYVVIPMQGATIQINKMNMSRYPFREIAPGAVQPKEINVVAAFNELNPYNKKEIQEEDELDEASIGELITSGPFEGATRASSYTKKHVPLMWESMLGTVNAMAPGKPEKYFDYDWEAARQYIDLNNFTNLIVAKVKDRYQGWPEVGKIALFGIPKSQ